MKLHRHDMLLLDESACRCAHDLVREHCPGLPPDLRDELITPKIPAIVRRQEQRREGLIEVGFSSHRIRDGARLRVSAVVPLGGIAEVITPYQAIALPGGSRSTAVLRQLSEAGSRFGVAVGLFGSHALERITGLPYTNESSDLDLCIRPAAPQPDLATFYAEACAIGTESGLRLDIEADCGGYGVKLKELLSHQKTVLGKGLYEVRLLPRDEALFGGDA